MGLRFDGSNYISVANSVYLNPAQITFDAWIYIDSLPNAYNSVVSKEAGGAGYTLLVKSNGKLAVYLEGVGNYDGTGTFTLLTGQWYHLAFTWDGTNLIGYVNGNVDSSAAPGGTITHSTGVLLLANSFFGNRLWRGIITESAIWNRALTLQEIESLYKSACRNKIQVAGNGLQAYWRLNDVVEGAIASGTNRIQDLTGNGNLGTPYNNPVGAQDILSYPAEVIF
jgi:hypothetical protein